MIVLLTVATIVSLAILYKYLPNRKIFIYFCLSLVLVFASAGFIARSQKPQQDMDETQIYALQQQQKIFIGWYTNYQKDIDQLDRNWQLYHNIIDNFKDDNIDVETLHERLANLETEARIEQVHIYTLKPPPDMGEECNALIEEIIRKTQRYVDAQTQTISQSRVAGELEFFLAAGHQEQVHILQDIIIREAPTGLFTAVELSAILHYFTLPQELSESKQNSKSEMENVQ